MGTSGRNVWQRLSARMMAVLAVLCLHLIPPPASGCPNCKQAIASQKNQGLAEGLNYTILGMIGLPFLLVGTIGAVAVRAYRRQEAGRCSVPDAARAGHGPGSSG